MTKSEIENKVKEIQKLIAGKGVQAYHDYPLETIKLKKRYTEHELEEEFNIFFCNGLDHNINKITLVYSAYEGFISIIPEHNDEKDSHESYFNLIGQEETNDDLTYNLWQELNKLPKEI